MSWLHGAARRVLPAGVRGRLGRLANLSQLGGRGVPRRLAVLEEGVERSQAAALLERYPDVASPELGTPDLNRHEARILSQNGEDGVLLHLFSRVGTGDRRFVEFGVEDGRECNAAALAIHFGWSGLLMEGSPDDVERARRFYRGRAGDRVRVRACWVTAENIDSFLVEEGFGGELDLLSIDVDGNDYWIWRAVCSVRPRVVVVEYNASLGPEEALTVPYDPDFDHRAAHPSQMYHGASLAALEKLGREKGYDLVGCESAGVNAFFVRGDLAEGRVEAVSAREAWRPHRGRTERLTQEEQRRALRDLPWVEVAGAP